MNTKQKVDMNYRIIGALVCLSAMLAGCASIETSSWQAPSNKFPEVSTYSWAPEGLQTESDSRINREFLAPRIVSAVEAMLNEKGYHKVEEGSSLLLKPSVQIREKEEQIVSQTDDAESEAGSFHRKGKVDWEWVVPDQVNVEVYEEGTLLLTVMDAASGKTLWQGSASLRVNHGHSPQQKEQLLKKVIRTLMKPFPKR